MGKDNFSQFIKGVRKEVMFTIADAAKPEFAEWNEVGDKGVPFAFFNGEILNLPKKEDITIWGRNVKINGKKYPMLFTAIHSNRRGWIEVPIAAFRRIPALQAEIDTLCKGNEIGASLIPQMPDIRRIEILISIVGEKEFVASEVVLHKNGFDKDKNKPILDDPNKEEKDRFTITCYRFNFRSL